MTVEDLGVALPKNRRTPLLAGLIGLVGLVPIGYALSEVFTTESLKRQVLAVLVVGVLTLLFVVAPAVYLWFARTFGVSVGPDAATWTRNGVAERQLRYRDLTEVWGNAGSRGLMGTAARSVTLNGTDPTGAPVQIHVGRNLVASLAPLLEPVSAEVARRPGLTKADPEGFTALVGLEK